MSEGRDVLAVLLEAASIAASTKRVGLRFDAVFHSIAFSFDHDGFRMMQQSVKDGGGQG
jgi:hypothetical protein